MRWVLGAADVDYLPLDVCDILLVWAVTRNGGWGRTFLQQFPHFVSYFKLQRIQVGRRIVEYFHVENVHCRHRVGRVWSQAVCIVSEQKLFRKLGEGSTAVLDDGPVNVAFPRILLVVLDLSFRTEQI